MNCKKAVFQIQTALGLAEVTLQFDKPVKTITQLEIEILKFLQKPTSETITKFMELELEQEAQNAIDNLLLSQQIPKDNAQEGNKNGQEQ